MGSEIIERKRSAFLPHCCGHFSPEAAFSLKKSTRTTIRIKVPPCSRLQFTNRGDVFVLRQKEGQQGRARIAWGKDID
jgi:hypothetical protein